MTNFKHETSHFKMVRHHDSTIMFDKDNDEVSMTTQNGRIFVQAYWC